MKRFFIFALIATVFAACSTDSTQDLAPEIPTSPDELYVSFDEEDSRVQLGENGAPVWTEGDLVSVFYRSNSNDKYKFDGKTGDTDGTLTRISSGVASVGLEKIVAVYPYSEDYLVSLLSGDIIAFLPETQYYEPDSYGIGSSIMISASKNSKLSFRNVCGWLKLQFTGSGSITRIVLRGNNGEQVAGHIYIHPDDASCTLASEIYENSDEPGDLNGALNTNDTALTSVTLNCGDGVTLNSETPTAFYIALPPQTFAQGITITAVCDGGTARTKSTENSLTVERNHIVPMASLAVEQLEITETPEIPDTPAQPTPPANEIWYTSKDGEIVYPYDTSAFGAPIISSTYKDGKGVIKFNENITSIGYKAFYNCEALTSVTIPNSVTSIGSSAFYNCSALKSITIPNSVTEIGNSAFLNCSALTSITIPDSVTEIGEYTFSGCYALKRFYGKFASEDNRCLIIDGILNSFAPAGLTTYTIPNSVTEIGENAFHGCGALESVTIPNSVTSIGYAAFYNCSALKSVNIPNSVTEIGEYAFYYCKALTSVTIGNSVTSIGEKAFYLCSALTSINIPNSVTSIGTNVFYNCTGELMVNCNIPSTSISSNGVFYGSKFTSVIIGDSVTSIGKHAFYNCSALKSITIPNSVTSIGDHAFYNCSALTRVDITNLEAWCKISFSDYYANPLCKAGNLYLNGELLENVVIPKSITELKERVFYGAKCIKSVTIPNSVTSIGEDAFYNCSALESVTIGNSVTSIGNYAFYGCYTLTSITIPNSVTEIGEKAFYNCSKLKEVYCKPTTPPTGGSYMFDSNVSGRRIYVPAASVDAYKAASYWSSYKSYIEPYNFT